MNREILRVDAVEKEFDRVKAVDGLSFDVCAGEIFALLGPNGAGKTTTVRMLTGITRPDRGMIRYALTGEKAAAPAPSQLGYLPEDRGLYKDLPVLRTLTYFGVLRGMNRSDAARAAEQWLERLGLRDRAQDKLDTLSKGNQQKVQFIATILHRPSFAVLDEPFSGLDPVNQDAFLELIRELRRDGMTILLSAHQMHLVERIADRILLINCGREVLKGSLEEIRRQARVGNKIRLKVAGEPSLSIMAGHPAVESAQLTDDDEITLLVRDGASLSELLILAGKHWEITGIRSEQASLHEIYVRAVGTKEAVNENETKVAAMEVSR
ncbi:MAG TPA: ATP-binding cassette domain-containing protein [Blastocatellia bacterium]|nr:ATP-binding cassette domain-containing protein [Blastocatellia bacterium]